MSSWYVSDCKPGSRRVFDWSRVAVHYFISIQSVNIEVFFFLIFYIFRIYVCYISIEKQNKLHVYFYFVCLCESPQSRSCGDNKRSWILNETGFRTSSVNAPPLSARAVRGAARLARRVGGQIGDVAVGFSPSSARSWRWARSDPSAWPACRSGRPHTPPHPARALASHLQTRAEVGEGLTQQALGQPDAERRDSRRAAAWSEGSRRALHSSELCLPTATAPLKTSRASLVIPSLSPTRLMRTEATLLLNSEQWRGTLQDLVSIPCLLNNYRHHCRCRS